MTSEQQPISKRIDNIVRNGLHPHLQRLGFRKRGRTFRRQCERHWEIVSVSGGQHNTNLDDGSIGSFGIELGIHFPPVFAIDGVELTREPGIHECYVCDGLALSGHAGFFDDFEGNDPTVEERTQMVSDAWSEQGEEWFAALSDYSAAYQWLRDRETWRESMYFAIYLNDKAGAAEALNHCRRAWGGLLLEHIEAIAARHGVVADKG
ncbi:hypothetical protein Mal4_58660 [Maioricimonas rarisocia]|uniref:DUF4304 domain-containing protein n=1 Tax=Maioricimonas rarisocia TaxID=2528026 RepID=A0A517ZG86_9PLAN|nr:DUF4304 domain-containing protein [Maioricimonas rarisocia]QDU41498.1 hypothetical protein Mal4_58660 [Maioricimonas rarisocia]